MTVQANRRMICITLLTLIFMASIMTVHSGVEYKYENNKGVFKFDVQTLKSVENRLLVNIVAHMLLVDDNIPQDVFMPITFSSVSFVPMPDQFKGFIISLPFQCGDLRIKFKKEQSNYSASNMEIRWFPECEYQQGRDCEILMPDIKFPQNSYYSCEKIKKYKCVKHPDSIGLAPKMGTLVISHLNLEIGGKYENVVSGKFTAESHPCD